MPSSVGPTKRAPRLGALWASSPQPQPLSSLQGRLRPRGVGPVFRAASARLLCLWPRLDSRFGGVLAAFGAVDLHPTVPVARPNRRKKEKKAPSCVFLPCSVFTPVPPRKAESFRSFSCLLSRHTRLLSPLPSSLCPTPTHTCLLPTMPANNIVVFAGDHSGPEVRCPARRRAVAEVRLLGQNEPRVCRAMRALPSACRAATARTILLTRHLRNRSLPKPSR